jgi:uncharacterized protein YkwD
MTDLPMRCQLGAGLLWCLLLPALARADVVDSVNTVRRGGCGGLPAVSALAHSTGLDAVARELSGGAALREAQRSAGYHAASSFSVSVSGVPASGDVREIIARQFCREVSNPAFREIGTYRRGEQVWIAFAEPFAPPKTAEHAAIEARILALVNAARAQARRCGATAFAAAPPVALNETLNGAARDYAAMMARYGYMAHTGHDGSSPAERVTRAGYHWRETGENLASGIMSAEAVVAGWVRSPEHCANLMDAVFTEIGVGYAVNPRDEAGVYWALEFGRPRRS